MHGTTEHKFPVLIGDVGGTNARFQIISQKGANPEVFDAVKTKDFESVEQAITRSVLQATKHQPKSAIIAAAGPVTKNGLSLTNCSWNIEPEKFLETCMVEKLILMNDFEAQSLCLPVLKEQNCSILGNKAINTQEHRTKVVLGPGTGLGVGLLVRAGGKWIPVAGEGGNVDLGPRTPRENEVWANLATIGGRISAEQAVSGKGLINLYQAICSTDHEQLEQWEAADISTAALEGTNSQAVEALALFCIALGRLAGDLALTSMATGGVYIAGGIAQKILPFLKSSGFRAAFDDKAPYGELMRGIPTAVITHPVSALLGLAAYANSPELYEMDVDHRSWMR